MNDTNEHKNAEPQRRYLGIHTQMWIQKDCWWTLVFGWQLARCLQVFPAKRCLCNSFETMVEIQEHGLLNLDI